MSNSSTSGKITFRCEETSNLREDKAAALFDSVFANQVDPLTSRSIHNSNSQLISPSPRRNEPNDETNTSSLTGSSYLSPPSTTLDLEKCDTSCEEASSGGRYGGLQSSTCTFNSPVGHAHVSDDICSNRTCKLIENSELDINGQKTSISKQDFADPIPVHGEESFQMEEDAEESGEQVPPQAKRLKPEHECATSQQNVRACDKRYTQGIRAMYKHRWAVEDDDDVDNGSSLRNANLASRFSTDDDETTTTNTNIVGPSGTANRNRWSDRSQAMIRDVKQAHECLKSGEEHDFSDDVKYILSTLLDPSSSVNVKCLSVVSLAKKCVSREFRQFFRSHNLMNRTLKAVPDSAKSPSLALCISAVIYLLSRDTTSVFIDASSLRLLSQLLKQENPSMDEEYNKYSNMVMEVLREWLEKSFANVELRKVQFDITSETLSPSFLILESLVYICARKHREQSLQNELLNVGILQWIVSKMDKMVLHLLHEKISDDDVLLCLKILERCFRVLELATVCNEKNGAYLISHRGNALIQSCGRLISLLFNTVERLGDNSDELKEQNITCLNRMAGLLMSLSYENELCSTKLGQLQDFLSLCVASFTYLVPKYVPKEKQFDLIVLLCSLLVNLLERCNLNRRKLIGLTIPVYDPESKTEKQVPTLKALSQLFIYHESLARSIDEELDNDLVFEDAPDDDGCHEDSADDSRLHGMRMELSEDEMVEVVQNAMNKASSHMEDSVLASYFALLIGCLLLQNEESVSTVKAEMKDGKLTALIEQLQRFLEFIKLTDGKKAHVRFMERIIDLLDTLDG